MKINITSQAVLLLVLCSRLVSAQVAYNPAAGEAKTRDFEAKIARTAQELGISVYEDLPVSAARSTAPQAAPVYTKVVRPAPFRVPEVPKPEQQPPAGNSMPIGNVWGYAPMAYHTISAQLADSGFLPWADAAPGFDEISRKAAAAVRDSRYEARKAGTSSLLLEEGFIKEMEALTGSKFLPGGAVDYLVDGPASFAQKDRLMKEAKKTIYVATYAIYDDVTGDETTGILLAKKKQGVDIKFMVDNKMAYVFGGKNLKRMAAAGIDVVRYQESPRTHDYLHVKMIIVDGEYAIEGGMNFGDPYSHKNPDGLKWRDTDVLYTGPAVADSVKLFAGMWNSQVKEPARRVSAAPAPPAGTGKARISVLLQNPPSLTPPILLSILKAIQGGTDRINIENAYIVAIPALVQALLDARARGVEVNILTNSKESIDSDGKSFADTIIKGMKVFADAGVNVYLKQGQTLHSKFMTVDGVFCSLGSYNLHPRSERYDTELNISVLDRESTARLDSVFSGDIAEARKVTSKDLSDKPGWLSGVMETYFYPQLSPKK